MQRINVEPGQHRPKKTRPWIARWSVDGKRHSRSFPSSKARQTFNGLLMAAAASGERFDGRTGLPSSMLPQRRDMAVAAWAVEWLVSQWPRVEQRTRKSYVEALARLVAATCTGQPPRNRELTAWLSAAGRTGEAPEGALKAVLDRKSLRLSELDVDTAERAAEAVDRRLDGTGRVQHVGRLLAAETAGRHRKSIRKCLTAATRRGLLEANPWPVPEPGDGNRKAVRAASGRRAVDIRSLPSLETAYERTLLMRNHKPSSFTYQTMSLTVLLAGPRPSECVAIRGADLTLPDEGWGQLRHTIAWVDAGADYRSDDDADEDEAWGEGKTGSRDIPLAPLLVSHLREYLAVTPPAPDGRIFYSASRGDSSFGVPTWSNWGRALHRVGLASPYEGRHIHATVGLRSGVPIGELAARLGHSPETLLQRYAGALADDAELANARLGVAFGALAPERLDGRELGLAG